jgi:hypothetical protein
MFGCYSGVYSVDGWDAACYPFHTILLPLVLARVHYGDQGVSMSFGYLRVCLEVYRHPEIVIEHRRLVSWLVP